MFALSVRQTNLNLSSGKLKFIGNWSLTSVYAYGKVFGLGGYTYIRPTKKGIAGTNLAMSFMSVPQIDPVYNQLGLGTSLAAFYMQPVKINKRVTLTPDLFVMMSPVSYATADNQLTTNASVVLLTGVSGDLNITKRFKLNWSYKLNYSVDQNTYLSMLNLGTKMNL